MKDSAIKKIIIENYKCTLPILGKTSVTNGIATRTDLDVTIQFPLAVPDGIYEWCVNAPRLLDIETEEFPLLNEIEKPKKAAIGDEFLAALKRVSAAQSKDETKYVLNSVYLESERDTLTLTATDGKRLHSTTIKANGQDFKAIIPSKAVERMLKYAEGFPSVMVNDQFARFTFSHRVTIQCKLIEGMYPNYRQVIPQSHQIAVMFTGKALLNALKEALPASKAAFKQGGYAYQTICMTVNRTGDTVFHAPSTINEIAEMRFPCTSATSLWLIEENDSVCICFQIKNMIDAITAAGDGEIELTTDGDIYPAALAAFRSMAFTAIVMPLENQ